MITTSTVTLKGGRKEPGWCDAQGVEHCWEAGPTLTVNPPIQTRRCVNCGKEQRLSPSQWQDC